MLSVDTIIKILGRTKEIMPEYSFFGDNNHRTIDDSVYCLKKFNSYDEFENCFYGLVDEGLVNEDSYGEIQSYFDMIYNDPENFDIDVFIFGEIEQYADILVNVCNNLCNECPFSNKSMKGWLADYSIMDIPNMMSAELMFPCHKTMNNGNIKIENLEKLYVNGKLKICRGYLESMVKSDQLPKNKFIIEAVNSIKDKLSENSMDKIEFIKHHTLNN